MYGNPIIGKQHLNSSVNNPNYEIEIHEVK